MRLLPKHYLWLSSFCLLLSISSCRISKYKHTPCNEVVLTEQAIMPIIKGNEPLKYKTTIDVLKKHLSGILIVKQTDSLTTHFVFVTELGMKMFDFVYTNHKMQTNFVFEPLNKPKLINSLMRNFENMFLLNAINNHACEINRCIRLINDKTKNFYTGYDTDNNAIDLKLQETFYKRKRTSKINYAYNATTRTFTGISTIQYGLVKIYIDLIAIQ